MKQFLFYAIPVAFALVACDKNKTTTPLPPATAGAGVGQVGQTEPNAVTLSVGGPQIATAKSQTELNAPTALGTTPAEFAVGAVDDKGSATITVANAQLPGVDAATGSVVGVVKLTLSNLADADKVSAQLKDAAAGDAAVQVIAAVPTTGALEDGKLKTPLTATATPITPASNSKELYLLFQSGASGFSTEDKAVVEITAKGTTFTVTIIGEGTKYKAKNQTSLNKVTMVAGDKKKAAINSGGTTVDAPDATSIETLFSVLTRADAAGKETSSSVAGDLNIVIVKDKGGDFKAAAGGKIGIVQLKFTEATNAMFFAKIGGVFGDGSKYKVVLMNAEPTTTTASVFNANMLSNPLTATVTEIETETSGTSNQMYLLFQGGITDAGFAATDAVIVEITATLGNGDNKVSKTFTVDISVAK